MTTTDQPMDVRDWLWQQQQKRMRQQIESITPSQEDIDHDAAQAVERHVTFAGQECHDQVSAAEDELLELSSATRDLRSLIMSGAVSREDAIKRLQDLHKQRDTLLAKIKSTRTVYESVRKTAKDPAAHVSSLRARFPALQG
jgi:uncharacterized coiled-coil DUF342 family protein